MAVLITVAALDLGHIFGLGALISSVALAVTVTAYELLLLSAVLRHVALLATVEATTRTSTALGTVASKVTAAAAFAALNIITSDAFLSA